MSMATWWCSQTWGIGGKSSRRGVMGGESVALGSKSSFVELKPLSKHDLLPFFFTTPRSRSGPGDETTRH